MKEKKVKQAVNTQTNQVRIPGISPAAEPGTKCKKVLHLLMSFPLLLEINSAVEIFLCASPVPETFLMSRLSSSWGQEKLLSFQKTAIFSALEQPSRTHEWKMISDLKIASQLMSPPAIALAVEWGQAFILCNMMGQFDFQWVYANFPKATQDRAKWLHKHIWRLRNFKKKLNTPRDISPPGEINNRVNEQNSPGCMCISRCFDCTTEGGSCFSAHCEKEERSSTFCLQRKKK